MKQQDIDKKIGMPDVDAEWARFECEVIGEVTQHKKRSLAPWAWGIGIAASIAVVAGLFFFGNGSKVENEGSVAMAEGNKFEVPEEKDENDGNAEKTITDNIIDNTSENLLAEAEPSPEGKASIPMPVQDVTEDDFSLVEESPHFPGGDRAMVDFIKKNLRYPAPAKAYVTKGRVIMSMMIDTLGQVSDIKALKFMLEYDPSLLSQTSEAEQTELKADISRRLEEECARVIALMPTWQPGRVMGNRTNVKYYIPFQLQSDHLAKVSDSEAQDSLQRHIARLDIVPNSSHLGANTMRLSGTSGQNGRDKDSVLVMVDGEAMLMAKNQITTEENLEHFLKKDIESIMVYKDEDNKRPYVEKYGELAKNGVVYIKTKPTQRTYEYEWLANAAKEDALQGRIAGLDNPEHRLLSSVKLLGSDSVGELKFIANHIYGEELIKQMHIVTFRASKRHKWMPFYYKEMERLMSPKNLSFGMGCDPSNSNEWILYYDSVAHSLIYKKSGKNIWWSMRRAISKEKKTSDNKTIWVERKKPKKIRGAKVETSSIAITAKQAQDLRAMWTDAVACANNARNASVMKAYTSDFWRYEFPLGDLRNKMSYIYTGLNPFTKFTNDLAEAVRTENISLTDSLLADTTLRKCLYDMKEYMKPVHLIEDSLVLVVNKQVQPDSLCKLISKRPKQYFHQKGLIVKATTMWTAIGAKFSSGYDKNCPIMELTTLPDTLSDTYVDLHPEMKDTLRHISGIVLDENEKPLVDAWVSISGNAGSPTDSTGRFSFWAPRSVTSLRAECTGYKKTIIKLSDTTHVIHMEDITKIKPVKVLPKEQIREIQGLPWYTKSDSIKR